MKFWNFNLVIHNDKPIPKSQNFSNVIQKFYNFNVTNLGIWDDFFPRFRDSDSGITFSTHNIDNDVNANNKKKIDILKLKQLCIK